MDRWQRRKSERFLNAIQHKAKKDMATWLSTLTQDPTVEEMQAWKAGYIAGINRISNNKEAK